MPVMIGGTVRPPMSTFWVCSGPVLDRVVVGGLLRGGVGRGLVHRHLDGLVADPLAEPLQLGRAVIGERHD
jgi:hypothetical protein